MYHHHRGCCCRWWWSIVAAARSRSTSSFGCMDDTVCECVSLYECGVVCDKWRGYWIRETFIFEVTFFTFVEYLMVRLALCSVSAAVRLLFVLSLSQESWSVSSVRLTAAEKMKLVVRMVWQSEQSFSFRFYYFYRTEKRVREMRIMNISKLKWLLVYSFPLYFFTFISPRELTDIQILTSIWSSCWDVAP